MKTSGNYERGGVIIIRGRVLFAGGPILDDIHYEVTLKTFSKTMKVLAREARREFGVLEAPEPQNRAKSLAFHAFPGSSAGFCTHGLP